MQIGMSGKEIAFPNRGMRYCDEVCIPLELRPRWYDKDGTIFDFGAAVATNGRFPQAAPLDMGHPDLRGVRATGADGRAYRGVVNFGHETREWQGASPAQCTAKVI